ncbi:MAG TPA: Nramp family divalent metal transporter [Anaerolineae bacterium]
MADTPNIETPEVKVSDVSTVRAATDVLTGQSTRRGVARILPFIGPAVIASVAYMDPGNFATNIQGGAQFGYMLLWVVIASNLMAMLVQSLSAKLGIASGHNLAEQCRIHFRPWVVWLMWGLMELVAMATDLAEFLGAALGFNLLLGIPLWIAGLMTAIVTFLILGLERRGFRPLEAVITGLVGVIALCYLLETGLSRPPWLEVAGGLVPRFSGSDSILLATGILGATVMPHVIFLHSALTQGRVVVDDPALRRRLFHYEVIDVTLAMGVAGLVNAAMLMMAAATFHSHVEYQAIGTIQEAYKTLEPLLGRAASWVFGLSLLASGLSSSAVGTMAGQVIMQSFLHHQIPAWLRRLLTMVPAMIVIIIGLDPTRTLVISQVILSFGLPFALIPLIMFTRRSDVMGALVNNRVTNAAVIAVAAVIVALNVYLLYQLFGGLTG